MIERPTDPTEVREWIFTWGSGQLFDGVAMFGKYVRIRGTFAEARAEMVRRYGNAWAFQYPDEVTAGVREFNLDEVRA